MKAQNLTFADDSMDRMNPIYNCTKGHDKLAINSGNDQSLINSNINQFG
jgi:hypothetical protein